MTHEDQVEVEMESWLQDARAGLSPRGADQARVLQALEKRLALPPQPPSAASAAQRLNSRHAPAAGPTGFLVRWAVRALLPLAGVGAVAMIATQLRFTTPTPTLRPAKPVAAAVTDVNLPELAAASDAQELVPAHQTESQDDSNPPPKKKKPQPKKCRAANGQERPCEMIKSSETALAASEPRPPAPPTAASLSKELEALRQAQRALRSGQAAQALSVLEAFEREAGGAENLGETGKMQEERAAAATMARCALARSEQDKSGLFGEFVQRYPKSAYAARLRRTCLQQP